MANLILVALDRLLATSVLLTALQSSPKSDTKPLVLNVDPINVAQNYDEAVLEPLHEAQAVKAEKDRLAAIEAAKQAEIARQADLAKTANNLKPLGTYNASSYFYHECVWYVASRIRVAPYLGNAAQWIYSLPQYGFRQGVPRRGAIGITQVGYYGHAVIAEEVRGNLVMISEYNYIPYSFDERWVSITSFSWFFK